MLSESRTGLYARALPALLRRRCTHDARRFTGPSPNRALVPAASWSSRSSIRRYVASGELSVPVVHFFGFGGRTVNLGVAPAVSAFLGTIVVIFGGCTTPVRLVFFV
jgi:hypothetical protein